MKNYTVVLCCLFLLCLGCRNHEKELKITEYVNPFIGTGAHGHCFPGAAYPFGAIQLSPDNPRNGWTGARVIIIAIVLSLLFRTHISVVQA